MLTSAAIAIAALRYYVSIPNPYLVWIASFCVLQIILFLVRKMRRKKIALLASGLGFALEAALFAAGAAATVYGLLAIYPPNIT